MQVRIVYNTPQDSLESVQAIDLSYGQAGQYPIFVVVNGQAKMRMEMSIGL